MGVEIERKFLLAGPGWKDEVTAAPRHLYQGYFPKMNGSPTVRVRIDDERAFLTIKGRPCHADGLMRSEYEYPVPTADAERMMLEFCGKRVVRKLRYCFAAGDGLFWEIDEYLDLNSGLFTAEIELPDPETEFQIPEWLGREISGDSRYTNGALSRHPYSLWSEEDKNEQ